VRRNGNWTFKEDKNYEIHICAVDTGFLLFLVWLLCPGDLWAHRAVKTHIKSADRHPA
jgi:hypothetical protein